MKRGVSLPFAAAILEVAMSEDWAVDVRKYAPNADDKAIAGIVRYFGIA